MSSIKTMTPEDTELHARARIGLDARPSGRLCLLHTKQTARLQQEWRGSLGALWLDVPRVEVDELPPHQ